MKKKIKSRLTLTLALKQRKLINVELSAEILISIQIIWNFDFT